MNNMALETLFKSKKNLENQLEELTKKRDELQAQLHQNNESIVFARKCFEEIDSAIQLIEENKNENKTKKARRKSDTP